MQFYEWNTKIYRLLIKDSDGGMWVIPLDGQTGPQYISAGMVCELEPVSPPQVITSEAYVSPLKLKSAEKRRSIISSLIEDDVCVVDKKSRNIKISQAAKQSGSSEKSVRRWYYIYLAQGERGLVPQNTGRSNSGAKKHEESFRWALNKYYYSARKMTLRQVYELMLLGRYAGQNGELSEDYPSFDQFKYYYRKHDSTFQSAVSRDGKTDYGRNTRPLYGRATDKVNGIGCYEMDATVADIYLVSSKDRGLCVGRPLVYLATDVASQLISGVYVGFERGEAAVIECLRNAVSDKVEYCKRFGITIEPDEWPSFGLPEDIISDKGSEFFGPRIREISELFGMRATSLPAYRPDLKGTVEKAFDLIQSRYKAILTRKGVISSDYTERGAPDYRREAKLTIYEYTQIVINVIVYLNAHRVIDNFIRPAEMAQDGVPVIASHIWQWYKSRGIANLTILDTQNQMLALFPRGMGKLTRRGLEFRGLYYKNREFDDRCARAGVSGKKKSVVAYDATNANAVWLFENGSYYKFDRISSGEMFDNASWVEAEAYLSRERTDAAKLRRQETQAGVMSMAYIIGVGEDAKSKHPDLLEQSAIKGIPDARTDEMTRKELNDGD